MRAQAATKIQKMVRKRLAIRRVERLRQERAARFVFQARTWVEYWNEDAAKWFYYSQDVSSRCHEVCPFVELLLMEMLLLFTDW
jgi:hypothetical protein